MFGTKEKKPPSLPVPPDVVFHAMPPSYQGIKGVKESVREAPLPQRPSPLSPSTVSPESVRETPQAVPLPAPRRKKIIIVWGSIAGVVVVLGVLAIVFLTPKQQQRAVVPTQENTPPPVAPSAPAPSVTETTPTPSVPEPAPSVAPEPKEIVSSLDTDQDGLTDVEEALYATDPKKADTDGDGYVDGQEVENLYNPSGTAPVRLADSSLVQSYTNAAFSYTLLAPASWTVRALDEKNPREVLFTASPEEFVQVVVDDNPENLSALQWYSKQFPDVVPASLERVFVDTMEGVWTKDKTTAYLTKIDASGGKRLLYGITYNYGERTDVHLRTTLQMMVQSFRVQ